MLYIDGKIDELHLVCDAFREHHETDAGRATDPADRRPRTARMRAKARVSVGLHLRAATPRTVLEGLLTRYIEVDHLPGGQREHGLRAERAHGGDESRVGQRGNDHRRAAADLQQDAAGGDHHELSEIVGVRRRFEPPARSGEAHVSEANVTATGAGV